jgi:hypothetical protein
MQVSLSLLTESHDDGTSPRDEVPTVLLVLDAIGCLIRCLALGGSKTGHLLGALLMRYFSLPHHSTVRVPPASGSSRLCRATCTTMRYRGTSKVWEYSGSGYWSISDTHFAAAPSARSLGHVPSLWLPAGFLNRESSTLTTLIPRSALPPLIRDKNGCASERLAGSARGAISNGCPYRDLTIVDADWQASRGAAASWTWVFLSQRENLRAAASAGRIDRCAPGDCPVGPTVPADSRGEGEPGKRQLGV